MSNISFWYCDACNEKIQHAKDGVFTWLTDENGKYIDGSARIVHNSSSSQSTGRANGCQYADGDTKKSARDITLSEMVGEQGMHEALQLIKEQVIPIDELCEIIQRVQLSNYERVRKHIAHAVQEGAIDSNSDGLLMPSTIQMLLEFCRKENLRTD